MVHDSASSADAGGVSERGSAMGKLGPHPLCPSAFRQTAHLPIRGREAAPGTRPRPSQRLTASGAVTASQASLREEGRSPFF
jgi:hypothetical protein